MRFAKFWKIEISELSPTERIFFRDAIRTIQAWRPLREEFADLEMIRRMLDEEILPPSPNSPEEGLTFRIRNAASRQRAE